MSKKKEKDKGESIPTENLMEDRNNGGAKLNNYCVTEGNEDRIKRGVKDKKGS